MKPARLTTPKLVLVALALAAGPAASQGRPSTASMTCGQVAQLVIDRRAVVLATGGQTFDRFVSDRTSCEATEEVRGAFVPTRDAPRCFVGYRCYEPGRGDRFERF